MSRRGHFVQADSRVIPNKLGHIQKITKTHYRGINNDLHPEIQRLKGDEIFEMVKRFGTTLGLNLDENEEKRTKKVQAVMDFLIDQTIQKISISRDLEIELNYTSHVQVLWLHRFFLYFCKYNPLFAIRSNTPANLFSNDSIIKDETENFEQEEYFKKALRYFPTKGFERLLLFDHPGIFMVPKKEDPKFIKHQLIGEVPSAPFPRLIIMNMESESLQGYSQNELNDDIAYGILVGFTSLCGLHAKISEIPYLTDAWGHHMGFELESPYATTVLIMSKLGCVIVNYQLETLSMLSDVGKYNQAWSSGFLPFDFENLKSSTEQILSAVYKAYS